MLLYILNCLYLCVWALLLIHCINSGRLYPIFSKRLGTKTYWLFTFVFFNPLLTFLYFLCVLCPMIFTHREQVSESNLAKVSVKTNIFMSVLVFVYTCFVILSFELPRTNLEKKPSRVLSKTDETFAEAGSDLLKSGLNIGVITAKNKIQTVSSDTTRNNARVNLQNLMLVSKKTNRVLDRIALKIQKDLVKLPYVKTVAYCAGNQQFNPETGNPDVIITLEMSELSEEKFLFSRKTHVKIACAANSSVSEIPAVSSEDFKPSDLMVPFTIQTELEHTSRSLCIECPGTEYQHEVKNISDELTEAITKQFENLLNKYQKLSKTSEKLYGSLLTP